MTILQIRTQAEVLQWIPQWMRGEFDCPSGAHEWVGSLEYRWCKHCPKRKREPLPIDDRNAFADIMRMTFDAPTHRPGGLT